MKLRAVEVGPAARPASGTIVLLHGYGADEHDLVPLAQALDPSLRVISLQGPHALGGGARAWFNLQQVEGGGLAYDLDEVLAAYRLVLEALTALGEREKVLLLGFSQGAALALCIGLTRPGLLRGVLSLSGVPPRIPDGVETAAPDALRRLPVFAAHGLYDSLLPIETGRAVRDLLQEKGVALTFREYPMGHQVVEPELADARAWLEALPGR